MLLAVNNTVIFSVARQRYAMHSTVCFVLVFNWHRFMLLVIMWRLVCLLCEGSVTCRQWHSGSWRDAGYDHCYGRFRKRSPCGV